MRLARLSLVLIGTVACAQQAISPAKALEERIARLRSLSDARRAVETENLAFEIRALRDRQAELALAQELSNFATEGDFGRATLLDVARTIADAIHAIPNVPDSAYDELARLVHYEGVDLSLNDPRFQEAVTRWVEVDKTRQESDFTLKDLAGESWQLKALKGKVVLVNFWATWCPPCRKEMPDLEALYNRFRGEGLVILAISDEEEPKVQDFINTQKYTYPILLDPGDLVNKRFRIQGIPKSLVYDRTGKLVAQASDMRTITQFLSMLKQAGLGE